MSQINKVKADFAAEYAKQNYDVIIDANRANDDEPWRVLRLLCLLPVIQNRNTSAISNLFSLYDHKGNLTAIWHRSIEHGQAESVMSAWGDLGECNLEHLTLTR